MTGFKRDAILRTPDLALSAWTCIRASITEHLADYNTEHPIGRRLPATIISETETSVVIEAMRGSPAGQPYSRVMVNVSAELVSSKIHGMIWRWLQHLPGTPTTERKETLLEFVPSGYSPVKLAIGGKNISPQEVVEMLLDDLFPLVP